LRPPRTARSGAAYVPLKFPGSHGFSLADSNSAAAFHFDQSTQQHASSSPPLDGKRELTSSDGAIGKVDGRTTSRFDHPQGMALVGAGCHRGRYENT